jgi:Ser/Thr protein kinase RdoA (MazF antagonist)
MQASKLKKLLGNWLDDPDANLRPVESTRFSGARLWRVESVGNQFVLRRWPSGAMTAARLVEVHAFQRRLANAHCPVPAPLVCRSGNSFLSVDDYLWELAPWMAGVADYHAKPSPEKLQAAFQTLAILHNASDGSSRGRRNDDNPLGASPAIENRIAYLDAFLHQGLVNLWAAVNDIDNPNERSFAEETINLAVNLAPRVWLQLRELRREVFFLTWCLRDVGHDHILFTEDHVTGVIDFGAAAIDTPAGDVARLLGSMLGDDAARRRFAVAAYESVRPLWPVERGVLALLDSSGVVLAALNWINWLFCDPSTLSPHVDRKAAMNRLQQLINRLRVLTDAE